MSEKKYEMAPGAAKTAPKSETDAQITAAAATTAGPAKDSKGPGRFGMKVGMDHPNRELYVSTTRAVAGVSVASFCGLLIGVVALSRNASHSGPQSAKASETHPSIVSPADRDPSPVKHVAATPAAKATTPKPVQVVVSTPTKPAPLVTSTPVRIPAAVSPTTAPTTPMVATGAPVASETKAPEGRVIGQTYFVFGSFPKASEAKRAAARLAEHGVTCTVEQSLPGWTRKGWYSVVSVKGFSSSKDASYQTEMKSLQAKELEPHGYTWRAVKGA
jgi:cytoskeletal protein RodZ